MKRRDFLLSAVISLILSKNAFAEIVWLKPGFSGYKEKTPADKKCKTCRWFKDDGKVADGGLCTSKAISKGKPIYVKKEGVCSMWQVIAKSK
jgi:hypothetical protein